MGCINSTEPKPKPVTQKTPSASPAEEQPSIPVKQEDVHLDVLGEKGTVPSPVKVDPTTPVRGSPSTNDSTPIAPVDQHDPVFPSADAADLPSPPSSMLLSPSFKVELRTLAPVVNKSLHPQIETAPVGVLLSEPVLPPPPSPEKETLLSPLADAVLAESPRPVSTVLSPVITPKTDIAPHSQLTGAMATQPMMQRVMSSDGTEPHEGPVVSERKYLGETDHLSSVNMSPSISAESKQLDSLSGARSPTMGERKVSPLLPHKGTKISIDFDAAPSAEKPLPSLVRPASLSFRTPPTLEEKRMMEFQQVPVASPNTPASVTPRRNLTIETTFSEAEASRAAVNRLPSPSRPGDLNGESRIPLPSPTRSGATTPVSPGSSKIPVRPGSVSRPLTPTGVPSAFSQSLSISSPPRSIESVADVTLVTPRSMQRPTTPVKSPSPAPTLSPVRSTTPPAVPKVSVTKTSKSPESTTKSSGRKTLAPELPSTPAREGSSALVTPARRQLATPGSALNQSYVNNSYLETSTIGDVSPLDTPPADRSSFMLMSPEPESTIVTPVAVPSPSIPVRLVKQSSLKATPEKKGVPSAPGFQFAMPAPRTPKVGGSAPPVPHVVLRKTASFKQPTPSPSPTHSGSQTARGRYMTAPTLAAELVSKLPVGLQQPLSRTSKIPRAATIRIHPDVGENRIDCEAIEAIYLMLTALANEEDGIVSDEMSSLNAGAVSTLLRYSNCVAERNFG